MESNEKAKGILAELRKLIFGEQSPELKFETHKLEDGTEITVASLEVGSEVKIGEELAPAGTHKLEDGSSIVLDEAGIILEVIAKEEPAPVVEDPLAAPVDMAKEFEAFRAEFGSHAQAFAEYKEATGKQLKTFTATIAKQDGIIQQLFALVTELTAIPAEDPLPVEKKTSQFSKINSKSSKKEKLAAAFQRLEEKSKV